MRREKNKERAMWKLFTLAAEFVLFWTERLSSWTCIQQHFYGLGYKKD